MRIQGVDDVMDVVHGLYAGDLVVAAVAELDLFTWLRGHEPAGVAEICAALSLDERAVDVTLTYLVAVGLLEREPDGRVRTSAVTREHLVGGGEGVDLRPYFGVARLRPGVRELAEVLRTGKPASFASADEGRWLERMDVAAFAREFSAGLDARARIIAPRLAVALRDLGYRRVLDLGGGLGSYSCALVEELPGARASVLELPAVVESSRERIEERGFAGRVGVVAGDMFGPLPDAYDLHLFSQVLRDWDGQRVRELMRRSFAALPPGGWLVDHDIHINDDKTGPPAAAAFSVLMVHTSTGKCWSMPELREMLEEAGFVDVASRPTAGGCSAVVARRAGP